MRVCVCADADIERFTLKPLVVIGVEVIYVVN